MLIFECRDFPVVEDQTVLAFCFHSQQIRTAAVELLVSVPTQAQARRASKRDLVALMILNRLVECLLSFELLVSRGRERDAAVLLVTLIELSLDLRYLEKYPQQVETWIAHSDRGRLGQTGRDWARILRLPEVPLLSASRVVSPAVRAGRDNEAKLGK